MLIHFIIGDVNFNWLKLYLRSFLTVKVLFYPR